jgi:hypothetical protein
MQNLSEVLESLIFDRVAIVLIEQTRDEGVYITDAEYSGVTKPIWHRKDISIHVSIILAGDGLSLVTGAVWDGYRTFPDIQTSRGIPERLAPRITNERQPLK